MLGRGTRVAVLSALACAAVSAAASACGEAAPAPVAAPDGGAADGPDEPAADAALADGGCASVPSYGSVQCNACIGEKCCEKLATCRADSTCRARIDCDLACLEGEDPPRCADDCAARLPDDAGTYQTFLDCVYGTPTCAFVCEVSRR